MTKRITGLRFGFAALAVAALTLTGLSPATAAGSVVGPNDVAGFENGAEGTPGYNYDTWHIGNTEDPGVPVSDSLTFNACSVSFLPSVGTADVTQLLKGFPVDGRPTANAASGTASLQALIDSISIDVAQGDVTIQLPTFIYYESGEGAEHELEEFTTVYNLAGFGPGVHTLSGMELTDSSEYFNGGDTQDLFASMQSDIDQYNDVFEILGVGMTGSDGAIVNSITFAGNTYSFGTGCSGEVTPPATGKPKPPVSVQTGIKDA
ncbi:MULTISPECIES: hypothetical protein [unclassified Leucobacter]|uniref:hypothetical protein n=1 Tax=unclassified Leucobacter TaxID=2621730 RepID=UPI00165E6C44|nr:MULTISPECIES: hypothetical protein [unclassified Leucobacter]MBC9928479.1 hypothetical protein [Leucobacter sp. cx-169]